MPKGHARTAVGGAASTTLSRADQKKGAYRRSCSWMAAQPVKRSHGYRYFPYWRSTASARLRPESTNFFAKGRIASRRAASFCSVKALSFCISRTVRVCCTRLSIRDTKSPTATATAAGNCPAFAAAARVIGAASRSASVYRNVSSRNSGSFGPCSIMSASSPRIAVTSAPIARPRWRVSITRRCQSIASAQVAVKIDAANAVATDCHHGLSVLWIARSANINGPST
ncbi:hypothetical protein SAMN04515660_0315 [Luteibacter sp. 329MFSha]|nr:hypothetical protein SAMN04515660_0315 [Luteibacter sp. 329MFSha]